MPKVDNSVKGDTTPIIFTVSTSLVGATARFRLQNRATGNTDVDVNCPVIAPAAGQCQWERTGLEDDGDFFAELEITFSSGKKSTWPEPPEEWVWIIRDQYG